MNELAEHKVVWVLVLLMISKSLQVVYGADERGADAVAEIRTLNEDALVRFKARINYSHVTASIQDHEKILLDWPALLKHIKISGQGLWENDGCSVSARKGGMVQCSGRFERRNKFFFQKQKYLNFELFVFSTDTNKHVADQAASLASITNMADVSYEYLNHAKADFYIYHPKTEGRTGHGAVIFSFRNVILKISAYDYSMDMRPFAEYFIDVFSHSMVDKERLPVIVPQVSILPTPAKVGEPFKVNIETAGYDDPEHLKADIEAYSLPEGLDYAEAEEGRYRLVATRPGDYSFSYTLMDTQRFIAADGQYTIRVEH